MGHLMHLTCEGYGCGSPLNEEDVLTLTKHAECVCLHFFSPTPDGISFTVQFLPAHLEIVRQLSAKLANLDAALIWGTIQGEDYAEDIPEN